MWKVLIADDEPKIRRGLRATIEQIRPDMQVVAEAEDGETALALVQKEKPDILMIDVRMPFLNGLDLIQKINEVWRDCVIIVVSGHDEFEYAQRALTLGVRIRAETRAAGRACLRPRPRGGGARRRSPA